jgi:hypothetical protein
MEDLPPRGRRFRVAIAAAWIAASCAGTAASQPAPGVDWRQSQWFPYNPATSAYQTQDQSGEDWWNHHQNSYDGSNSLQGYITAGFSTFVAYAPSELSTGGCLNSVIGTTPDCNRFTTTGNIPGFPEATLALVEPHGTFYYWYKIYGEGEYFRVIQTSDGGYLATGYTGSTQDLGGSPLYYNPGQVAGEVTDSFSPGNLSCPKPTPSQTRATSHATMVKVDAYGNAQWHYLYGLQPYQPNPASAFATRGQGWESSRPPPVISSWWVMWSILRPPTRAVPDRPRSCLAPSSSK